MSDLSTDLSTEPITDPSIVAGYLTDASNVQGGYCDALFRPRTVAALAEIVAAAQARAIPVTVTAARTSTTAGPIPFGGWLVSMEHLNAIGPIGHDLATAQGGVNLGAFQAEIEATGRFYPPDPTSRHDCTLGGSIACNASGARSFRYGATRRWVEAVEVVLPTGEVRRFRRGDPVPDGWPAPRWEEPDLKTAAGYSPPLDAVDLFIGQEGTLGILTEATVRLTDLPSAVIGLLAYFPDRAAAVRFVERARAAGRDNPRGAISPRCLEYFDHHCLSFAAERVGDVPPEARAALFCEQEVEPEVGEDGHLIAWYEAIADAGGLADATVVATDAPSQAKLLALRHAVPAGINELVVRNGMPKVGTDLAVPDAALDEMMTRYEQAPMANALFGHIGDNHLHLNLLPRTAEELSTARAFYVDLARHAIAAGGTVSAEHGIGRTKKGQLAMMVAPDVIEAFRALKEKLDPAWVLGRGVLFDR
jgi:FAD/FMN-containing dehydrogenase